MKTRQFTEEELVELRRMFGDNPEALEAMGLTADGREQAPSEVMEKFPDADLEETFGDDPEMLARIKAGRDELAQLELESVAAEHADIRFYEQLNEQLNAIDTKYARGLDADITELEAEERRASVLPFQKRR